MEFGYTVTLYTISKSYFDWTMYFWNNGYGLIGEFSGMGLAEPVWGYSNVSTGAGVVAAQTSASVTINLRPFLKQVLEPVIPDVRP